MHEAQGVFVIQVADRIYIADAVPWVSWTEICLAGAVNRPADEYGTMWPFGDDIILINSNGMYLIKVTTPYRYWQLNEAGPDAATHRGSDIEETDGQLIFQKDRRHVRYRYLVGFSRIKDTSSHQNNRTASTATLEHESVPWESDLNGQDYNEIFATKEAGPFNGKHADISAFQDVIADGRFYGSIVAAQGNLPAADLDVSNWTSITDGAIDIQLYIYYSATSYRDVTRTTAQMDFSNCKSLEDVLEVGQKAINDTFKDLADVDIEVLVYRTDASTVQIALINWKPGARIVKVASGSEGTDLRDKLGFDGNTLADAQVDYAKDQRFFWPTALELKINQGGNSYRNATHYVVYRTMRIDEDGVRAGNSPLVYVGVDDVPLINVWVGDVSTDGTYTYFTPTTGTYKRTDYSPRFALLADTWQDMVQDSGATTPQILGYDEANSRYIITTGTTVGSGKVYAIGATNVFTASMSGTTMTVAANHTLDSDDVGKPVWFASGKLNWIKSVTDSTHAEMIESMTVASTGAAMDPTARFYGDQTVDRPVKNQVDSLLVRKTKYPLRRRFHSPITSGSVGAVAPGWVFVAQEADSEYQYGQTEYAHLVGCYAPDFQKYDRVDGGIYGFISDRKFVTVRGGYGTKRVDLSTVIERGDAADGTNIDALPDPEDTEASIGADDISNAVRMENDLHMVFTNEPGIRTYNNHEHGPNLAEGRLQETDLQQLQEKVVLHYDHIRGLEAWGTRT
jgi:hypothetical protein